MQTTSSTKSSPSVVTPPAASSDAPDNNDIFTDPAIARAVVEDPFFRWLSKSWRQVLTVVVAVLLGSYAWSRFDETKQERLGEYAGLYQRAGEQFGLVAEKARELNELKSSLVAMDEESSKKLQTAEKALADARVRLEDTLKALGDTGEPYAEYADLYRGLSAAVAGEKDQALGALTALDWKAAASQGKSLAFRAELATLARARVLLDEPQKFSEGWGLLKELALGSEYVYVSAVVSMVRVAETKEQKAEAQKILEQVRTEHPAQAELLSQAISGS